MAIDTPAPTTRPICKHPGCTEVRRLRVRAGPTPSAAKAAGIPACRPGASAAA